MKHFEILNSDLSKKLLWKEEELNNGDWVYNPNGVHTAPGKDNIFQIDKRINYSLHFGHEPEFYKLQVKG